MEPVEETRPETTSFFELLVEATPRFFVTTVLVSLNVAYFVTMLLMGASVWSPEAPYLLELGANFGPLTVTGQWWRLVTSMFVHIGLIHLLFNMWCLWSLGNLAERMFGNWTYVAIYLLSGVGGSLASLFWNPGIISAGASGAIFGMAGALVAFLYLGHIHVPRPVVRELLTSVLIFVGFNLFFGAVQEGIDNAGHLGGLVSGLVLGAVLHRSLPVREISPIRYLILPATLLLFVGAFAVARTTLAENPDVLVSAAVQLHAAGKTDEAIEKLEQAAEADPSNVPALLQLARLTREAGRTGRSVEALERAVELQPDSAPLTAELGLDYYGARRFEDAIDAFHRAIELDPQLYAAQRYLGIALNQVGRKDEAIAAIRTAQRMEPSDLFNYTLLSQFLQEADRYEEAMAALAEALTWAPESGAVHSEIGLVRLRHDELTPAIESLRHAIELEPAEAEHYNRLALALAKAGEREEALAAIETALRLLPESPHLLDSLGTVYLLRDEPVAAVEAYERALELAPDQAVFHYNLSRALHAAGRFDEADAERRRAFELEPDLSAPADGGPLT